MLVRNRHYPIVHVSRCMFVVTKKVSVHSTESVHDKARTVIGLDTNDTESAMTA